MSHKLVNLEADGEAVEIVLGKPPKLVRFSIYLIALFLVTGLIWSYVSVIDVYIEARGAVRPIGDLVKVQPVTGGKLKEVLCREGQSVKRGDVLFRIDSKEFQNELDKSAGRIESARKQRDFLRNSQKNLFEQHEAEAEKDRLSVASAEEGLARARKSAERADASLREAEIRYREAKADHDRTKKLVEEKILSEATLISKESAMNAAEAFVHGMKASLQIAHQEVGLAEKSLNLQGRQNQIAEGERRRLKEDLESKLFAQEQALKDVVLEDERIRYVLGRLDVVAPIDGSVTAIAFRNAGEIVPSGGTLATLAVDGAPWIVEAVVPNKDAGPLRDKLNARVNLKFDAFPFRDYGVIEGKLLEVSPDALPDEKLGPVFKVRIGMESTDLKKNSRKGQVQLGMTVTAEIVKEEERVLLLLFKGIRDRVSP